MHLLDRPHEISVVIDINQPGAANQRGLYRQGPITSKVVRQSWSENPLPEGTLLYGQLWIEGIIQSGRPAVMGRYTEALLPDGRRFPVCVVLGDPRSGMIGTSEYKPGEATLSREDSAFPVLAWP